MPILAAPCCSHAPIPLPSVELSPDSTLPQGAWVDVIKMANQLDAKKVVQAHPKHYLNPRPDRGPKPSPNDIDTIELALLCLILNALPHEP